MLSCISYCALAHLVRATARESRPLSRSRLEIRSRLYILASRVAGWSCNQSFQLAVNVGEPHAMLNLQLRGFNAACSMIDEFSLTVHSSSLQFKHDGRSSIQFTVQFSSVYSLQFKYGGCSSMQFTVQFSSVQFTVHNTSKLGTHFIEICTEARKSMLSQSKVHRPPARHLVARCRTSKQ